MHWLLHHMLIFTIHYSTQFLHFYKQLLLYYAIEAIEQITRQAVSFEKDFTKRNF